MATKAKIGVLGASGYTGGELVRVLLRHPRAEIVLLTAERSAGKADAGCVSTFLALCIAASSWRFGLDWSSMALDVAFCALPHATTQKVIKELLAKSPSTKVVDLLGRFSPGRRGSLREMVRPRASAPELQREAVYGLTEIHRRDDKDRRGSLQIPDATPRCAQLPLIPLIKNKAIELDEIVVDAKSGMTGAGRAARESHVVFGSLGGLS